MSGRHGIDRKGRKLSTTEPLSPKTRSSDLQALHREAYLVLKADDVKVYSKAKALDLAVHVEPTAVAEDVEAF